MGVLLPHNEHLVHSALEALASFRVWDSQPPAVISVVQWALVNTTEVTHLRWALDCALHVPQLEQAVKHSMLHNRNWSVAQCQTVFKGQDITQQRLDNILL